MLCLALGAGLAWTWVLAASGEPARAFGPGYWPYLGGTSAALAAALVGLWRMRRWGPWALALALLVDDGVVAAMGELRPVVFVVQLALVAVAALGVRAARPRAPSSSGRGPLDGA